MFDSELKSAIIADGLALIQDPPASERRTFRRVSGTHSVVSLDTEEATLTLEVEGYEFPEALEGFDADWLVVRVTLDHEGGTMEHRGAILLADELASWAERVVGVRGEETFEFTEPNFRFACVGRDVRGALTVVVDLLGEPKEGSPRSSMVLDVPHATWKAFGRGLARLSRAFPQRSIRRRTGT